VLAFCDIVCKSPMPKPATYPKELLNLGDHLRKRRMDLKLSQVAVARILDVYELSISHWESNQTVPVVAMMPRIIAFLGYNPCSIDISTLGGRIKHYRYINGLSRKYLGNQFFVNYRIISSWEADEFVPSTENYEKLMQLLGNP